MGYAGFVVGAIIQARTGSSRFPRKIFADLAGRPLLQHILDRLRACRTVDKIVIATTREESDREILEFAAAQGVHSYAGSTSDVQSRFIEAAHQYGVEVIVRICGDSPFVDPEMIDRLVTEMLDAGGDYAEPDPATPAAYEGMEALTRPALERSRTLGNEGPDREHVTLFMRYHPDHFKIVHPKPDRMSLGKFRLSVDNSADLDFARAVYAELYRDGKAFSARDLARFLSLHPEVAALNAHVRQKATDAPDHHVAFYVSRHGRIDGLIPLARKLNEGSHCGIGFFGRLTRDEEAQLHEKGFRSGVYTEDDEEVVYKKMLRKWNVKTIILEQGDEVFAARLHEMGYRVRFASDPIEKILG